MTEKIITWLSLIMAILSAVAVVCIAAAEMYVRWSVNLDFSFLGGNALAALIIASFGLILGLAWIHRR